MSELSISSPKSRLDDVLIFGLTLINMVLHSVDLHKMCLFWDTFDMTPTVKTSGESF